jgi:hypothetical protein
LLCIVLDIAFEVETIFLLFSKIFLFSIKKIKNIIVFID